MNREQKCYIIKRVDEITISKINKVPTIDSACMRDGEIKVRLVGLPPSVKRMNAAIKSAGGIKLKSVAEIRKSIIAKVTQDGVYNTVISLKDISTNIHEILDNAENAKNVAYDAAKKKANDIIRRGTEVKDEIMLGDDDEALKILRKFESEKI